jgi:CRP/FNR family transcriptional regulator, anaerobic regulatory protein
MKKIFPDEKHEKGAAMVHPPPPRQCASPEPRPGDPAGAIRGCREADAGFREDCLACCLRALANCADGAAQLNALDWRSIHPVFFNAGAFLFHQGDLGVSLYSLRGGLLKLVQYQPNGTERIVRLQKKGGMAGLEALVCEHYHHSAIAVRGVDACRIPTGLIQRIRAAVPSFDNLLLQRWQQDIDLADYWICQFATGSTAARVARLLLFLVEFGELEPGVAVQLLSRHDMAGMLGVTCESVCRMISHFRQAGLIQRTSQSLYQCDVPALQRIAAG